MSLPLDLVLIRHGQSEGNAAKRLSEQGDDTGYQRLKDLHTRSYRLSKKGQEQAAITGSWLKEEFYTEGKGFDRFITSEYARAMETAALLDLPNAEWFRNFYLTERSWGDLESCPESEKEEKFGDALRLRTIEPFFWRPPNGESFAELCLRLDRVLQTLHRECSGMRVVIVCHGEVMRAFRVLLERMPQQEFRDLALSKEKEHAVFNCEVFQYTRRDPETGNIAEHANWVRRIRPNESPVWNTGWFEIKRPRYTNEQLLEIVREDINVQK
jgi:broad specificity phosphatase PhoE